MVTTFSARKQSDALKDLTTPLQYFCLTFLIRQLSKDRSCFGRNVADRSTLELKNKFAVHVQPSIMQGFLPQLGRVGDGDVLCSPDVTDVDEEGDTDKCIHVLTRITRCFRGSSRE